MTQENAHPLTITLGHLYPDQLNLYGDDEYGTNNIKN